MTLIYIPAWRESGADDVVHLIGQDPDMANIVATYEYIFPTREGAEKRARELQSRDDIPWPIYVYEKEVPCDPFSVDSDSTDSEVG